MCVCVCDRKSVLLNESLHKTTNQDPVGVSYSYFTAYKLHYIRQLWCVTHHLATVVLLQMLSLSLLKTGFPIRFMSLPRTEKNKKQHRNPKWYEKMNKIQNRLSKCKQHFQQRQHSNIWMFDIYTMRTSIQSDNDVVIFCRAINIIKNDIHV